MRQHGGVANTCIHGFAPGTCLICQTLQGGPATATKQDSRRKDAKPGRRAGKSVSQEVAPRPVRPDAVIPPARRSGGAGLGVKLLASLVVAVIVVVALWSVVGLVLGLLHIVELVAVAGVAGWLGWSLGVRHGRRTRT